MACRATGKTMFDEDQAYAILDRLQYSGHKRRRAPHHVERMRGRLVRIRRGPFKRREKRVYRCDHCGMWHLTSRT